MSWGMPAICGSGHLKKSPCTTRRLKRDSFILMRSACGCGEGRSCQVVERGEERIVVEGNVAEFQLVIMREFLERTFHLSESNTTIRTEILAGLTTFMTMSYIIFVQPAVLSTTGMDFGAVLAATCIVSAIGCFLMAFLANYPIAVAPAMGHNFFFAFTVVAAMHYSWQVALGAVFISGIVFLLMSVWGVREALVHAIPDSLKRGIAVGIGLLITLVGLEWSGFLAANPATLVTLG